jgi:hypothetical protein
MTSQEHLKEAIVRSTTLSCLLSIDYVNGAAHPPLEEMVANELPNVLRSITRVENLGLDLERELQMPFCKDPPTLVHQVVQTVTKRSEAIKAIDEYGHCDMVFGAMKYMRKPPQSDEANMDDMTRDIARILGCESCEESAADGVIQAYTNVHTSLIRM